jgi:hypothetical protein
MMTANHLGQNKTSSLTDQIKDTERKRLIHEHKVSVQAEKLLQDIHQEITAPGTLLLAGGIGFILGEFTKRQAPKPGAPKTAAPLKTVKSLISTANTLYSALPITWLIKSFYQSNASGKSSQRRAQPLTPSEWAAKSNDRRRPVVPPIKT